MTFELIKAIGLVLGVMLALPMLIALVKVTRFIGSMEVTMSSTATTLRDFVERADRTFDNHNERIATNEKRLEVLWDGRDRRAGERRNKNDGGVPDA